MKTPDLKKITKAMEKTLDGKRYTHTLGVAYTAAALAMRYDAPIVSAQTAGMLHDCAKCLTDAKRLSICEKHQIPVSDVERKNPSLLHAKVGSFLAMNEYQIEDKEILDAICYHTTGRPGMGLLEKIIFVADYIEPGRRQAPHLDAIRKMAFTDIDRAVLAILEDTLAYLEESTEQIDPMTQETYSYYAEAESAM